MVVASSVWVSGAAIRFQPLIPHRAFRVRLGSVTITGMPQRLTVATGGEVPYMLYSDMMFKFNALAWNGSQWNNIGDPAFSPMVPSEWAGTYFAANNEGTPFVGYPDAANQNYVSVLTYSS